MFYVFLKHFCDIVILNLLKLTEVAESERRERPHKRNGGGGYGYYKNMNKSGVQKDLSRTKIYKHKNRNKGRRQVSS